MLPRLTEMLHPDAKGIDAQPDHAVAAALLAGQRAAIEVIEPAIPAIIEAARRMAQAVRSGYRLIYCGAGSSALMALADAAELGGTFGIPAPQIRLFMAGGIPTDARMPGDTEDDDEAADRAAQIIVTGDVVIAVTASGSTPYPLALARAARARGAQVIGLANNSDAALFTLSDVAIHLATPPELVAGSTRLGAATAQKVALNMMSTLMGIRLGQVYDGMMVGLIADNAKLRARASATVARIADTDHARAAACLAQAAGAVKPAVLIALGLQAEKAAGLLDETDGNLRAAIARLSKTGEQHRS